VCVTLSRVTSQDVTLLVTITDGTPTGNIVNHMIILMYLSFTDREDYIVTQQLLLIQAGSTSSCYSIDIINDMIHEDDETFDLTITLLPTCLSVTVDGDSLSATVTIVDDVDSKSYKELQDFMSS